VCVCCVRVWGRENGVQGGFRVWDLTGHICLVGVCVHEDVATCLRACVVIFVVSNIASRL
jgi:hypothetical protein